jgi:outer membrane receptor protein involved in Fe transport
MKLRIGWGKTGNQEFPAGASQEQFAFSSNTSINQINVANPDLKWETTTSTNIGLDFTIFNNKVNGTVDYFYKNTSDVLFQLTAIQPAPATAYFINLPGNIINKGIELSLSSMIVQNKNFSWELGVNGTYLTNNFENYNGPDVLTGGIHGQGVTNTFSQIITNNKPINEFYLKQFSGFDKDGNSIIATNPTFAGDPNPHYLLGLSTTVTYKKLSFIVNARGAFGYKIYNNTATSVTNLGIITTGKNIGAFNIGSPQAVSDAVAASTRYLESGNYLKLGNATISYALGNIGTLIKGANIYLTGSNLFVITKFTGFDPEVNVDKSTAGVPSLSIEYVPYPTPRTITFGLNFTL